MPFQRALGSLASCCGWRCDQRQQGVCFREGGERRPLNHGPYRWGARGRVREVLRAPDPVLGRAGACVDPAERDVIQLVADRLATMRDSPGCVGLAAPQIGVSANAQGPSAGLPQSGAAPVEEHLAVPDGTDTDPGRRIITLTARGILNTLTCHRGRDRWSTGCQTKLCRSRHRHC